MENWWVKLCLVSLLIMFPALIHGWGNDGHYTVCRIAQGRLSKEAENGVKELVSGSGESELGWLCTWADHVKFRYHWSSALHFIDTPDSLCSYDYNRDCKDEDGSKGRCVAGAINNYTTQLLTYNHHHSQSQYNLTEALLFLAHFIGDIHQPLHVGFTSDRGANTIDVHWYTRKQNLHHIWDASIIETAEEKYYDSNVESLVKAIEHNITTEWADEIKSWETCNLNNTACPDIYASEGIKYACDWAYKDAKEGSVLEDDYFLSRLPIVNLRLAEAGVRLAATLNRIFG
ncbi:endonuclease 2 [Cannabis sativa]|uniref:endonuclease 2 n=1 Tax=Cannabis sativa TaxID=3483 RepID=UPI0029CA018E|nr:endonuclease 2 [Cannabis sativa]